MLSSSISEVKLSTISKVQLCSTLACRLKGNNSAMTYIFVVLDLLVYVCAWNVSKATPWRTNRNKKTGKVNTIARLFTLKKIYWPLFPILNQQKQYYITILHYLQTIWSFFSNPFSLDLGQNQNVLQSPQTFLTAEEKYLEVCKALLPFLTWISQIWVEFVDVFWGS